MKIKIRDWTTHFERDRTKQWKHLEWVPIPNKQGIGYRKIMRQKEGPTIFGCWIALVEVASTCTPRGDLTKYNMQDLSDLTLIDQKVLLSAIEYLSKTLDWIEVILSNDKNLDTNVNNNDSYGMRNSFDSSILSSSILSSSSKRVYLYPRLKRK